MLDIKLFRENPDIIRESERKRFRETQNVDKVIEFDTKWRKALQDLQDLRAERNKVSRSFKTVAKEGPEKIAKVKKKSAKIKEKIQETEPLVEEYLKKRDFYRHKVGNILISDVPIAENEEGDKTLRTLGDIPKFKFEVHNHVDLVSMIDGAEIEKATKIAGSRFYYLKGDLVKLNLALLQYALDFLTDKGFTPFWTPYFMKHEVMAEAAELADFEEQLYKIEGEDLYLIATSEQTLAALHRKEVIDEKTLPRRYCGISSCFRREAGSHGKDTLGIFRVHRFEKIEQFIFCKPEDSNDLQEELISNAEKIYENLKIPYRVVSIASGELNDNAAKKYDLEGYFPASKTYRELVSCSNCTDYQARKLNIRSGIPGDKSSFQTLHTLNSTAIANQRTICCILENYQQADGTIKIPEVLIPYMNGKKIMKPN
ncbi:serine--tRNA ligase [Promethearchaeum syntrophicum]|uniref:Serine--tRNA ligase n=1 Tax=Promethearchaeum syntrophicum TaxID=2594042 RepID=A0A5B9D7I3_9ARCH|nr:serine--tRNA ligase [Candidatus Prometheoarchaeum syntrophicum]QEE14963.1 Serine--tRNA ligase [Candidatus Prometheoarchaeum syntrophicum]